MSNDLADELMDSTYYILETHSAYGNPSGQDTIRYFLPPEFVERLSWFAVYVIVPILTGAGSSIIADRLKKNKNANSHPSISMPQLVAANLEAEKEKLNKQLQAMQQQQYELERLKAEINEALKDFHANKEPSHENISFARASLEEILMINGWPKQYAEIDAEQIVEKTKRRLWPSEN